MTYKTLRRKSDGQWMDLEWNYPLVMFESKSPQFFNTTIQELSLQWFEFNPDNPIDWSLYELVTVHCIAEDELPSDSQIHDKVALLRNIGSSSYVDDMKKLINWYKSQILKP